MIRPNTKPAHRYKITTYDLEWRSSRAESIQARVDKLKKGEHGPLHVRHTKEKIFDVSLLGAYDERGYRAYSSVEHFLLGELTPQNAGRRFYAHFGGASDMVFLLKPFLNNAKYEVRAIFSGSSAILVRIVKDDLVWDFIDSFWLLRVSLAKIGDWKGLPKMEVDFQDASFAELAIYNERDCKILHDAVCEFQELILEKGGQLGITASSTSMDLFLRKYLSRDIRNPEKAQVFAQEGYVASRVERFRASCERAGYFDINSSFPFSMTWPCPGSPIGSEVRRLPDPHGGQLFIAEVTVSVAEGCYVPPVPYRGDDRRIFFPTGKFRTVLTQDDLQCQGVKIEQVHRVQKFEARDDLKAFAEDMYAMRQKGGFEKEVWKIVGNGNYGKWAERSEKQILLINPAKRDPETQQTIIPGVYIGTEEVKVRHRHVPISMMITARSRRFLHEYIVQAHELGNVYYCDTDSVICDAELPTNPALGGLKKEHEVVRGKFVGAKLYAIEHTPENGKTQKVKAKGFSRVVSEGGERQGLSYADFIEISEGKKVVVERMLRIRELVRKEGADYVPRSIEMGKKINVELMGKRKMLPGGDSRPWTKNEIDELTA